MGKKKYFVGLLILLLTLLLGSFSSSYGWSYNEVKGTIENVIINSGYNNDYLTNLNTWIHNEVSEEWEPIFSSYDNFMITCNRGLSDNISNINQAILIYAWNDLETDYNLYETKYTSSVWALKSSVSGIVKYTYSGTYDSSWNNNEYYTLTGTQNMGTGSIFGYANRNNPPQWVIFTNKPILANSTGGTATQSWNTYTRYIPMVWNFTPTGSTVSINNGGMSSYHTIDSIYNCNLGLLKDSIYARKITYNWGTWNGSTYNWGRDITLYDHNRNGYLPNYFIGSTTNTNDINNTTIYLNTNGHANDILALTIESDNSTLRGTIITFYLVTNNYSNIVGGVFYPGSTFSGDYNDQYQQQQNTNEIIGQTQQNTQEITDTLTDGSEVDNILNEFGSGDMADTMGYHEYGSAWYDIFSGPIMTFVNAINDTLLDNADVYWDYSMHGESPTRIYASDFTTPNGLLKTFLRYFMIFATLYVIYLHFKQIIEKINSGNAINVLREEDADMYFVKM